MRYCRYVIHQLAESVVESSRAVIMGAQNSRGGSLLLSAIFAVVATLTFSRAGGSPKLRFLRVLFWCFLSIAFLITSFLPADTGG
jgi:hypothetical protein